MGELVEQGRPGAELFAQHSSNETLRDQYYYEGQTRSLSVATGIERYSQDRQAPSVAGPAMKPSWGENNEASIHPQHHA